MKHQYKNTNLKKTRLEHDLLGEMEIPDECYYGIQTFRALENFKISKVKLSDYTHFIIGLANVKAAAAKANHELGLLKKDIYEAIIAACEDIKTGKFNKHFVVDMIQGGAGTSTNMNANEVIANIALEKLGHQKGEYQFCHPNNHVNLSQSTNDAYPTALKLAIFSSLEELESNVQTLIEALHTKSTEFSSLLKMGRTQLQDAVPMTLGQEFEAFSSTLKAEKKHLKCNREFLLETNMGATAIGTGINSDPDYASLCTKNLAEISKIPVILASDLIDATSDTGAFVSCSSALKRLAIKLSKIANDLRLLSSGPRAGLQEINLPAMQPGSSIMPGKVNPVIPEAVNQVAFKVIGNDLTVTLASEGAQLQLNVMEPIIAYSILESIELLNKSIITLRDKCIVGITANEVHLKQMVQNSIGLVTAINPYLGYEMASKLATEALQTGKSVYQLVLDHKLMDKQQLDDILKPENMIMPRKLGHNKANS